ncbi:MAG: substrate-binding domain-containing protein [Anaerolineae bacterium]|nr:substrate-binding domain-containing protein [Anaerolineae bacterium]
MIRYSPEKRRDAKQDNASPPSRPILGFLCSWDIYNEARIDPFEHDLLRGISAAARERDCNLLLSCGSGLSKSRRPAWPVANGETDFLPVGPWNTDGLIIVPEELTPPQIAYVQALTDSGFPIVLTAPVIPGAVVAIDNIGGVRQAIHHLLDHGHRQIAFIAGKARRSGDSLERLLAYQDALREAGLEIDERLIALKQRWSSSSRMAMQQILDSGAPFTAVLASNDFSALDAIEALREAGRRVPDDVAVIGFDDRLHARGAQPPLTTVRHPTFELGFRATHFLIDRITGKQNCEEPARIATQLVIRRSCGCQPAARIAFERLMPKTAAEFPTVLSALARGMAEAALPEMRHSSPDEIEDQCLELTRAFVSALSEDDLALWESGLTKLFGRLDLRGENVYPWHAAFTTLRRHWPTLQPWIPRRVSSSGPNAVSPEILTDYAHLRVSEQTQNQLTTTWLQEREVSNQLEVMSSELLKVLETSEVAPILNEHLPLLGIEHALVVVYTLHLPEEDSLGQGRVLLQIGLSETAVGCQFQLRRFPPPGIYAAGQAFQLALLPLVVEEQAMGFVAFSAANLKPLAAIVQNLASALRSGHLYEEALEARQVAEEANRLQRRFLSTVSHELRTPLSLIVSLSDMLLQTQHGPLQFPEASRRDIEQINLNAQHLGRLINDVLDLASCDAGQLRLLRQPLDLTEVLCTVASIGKRLAQGRGLRWCASWPKQALWVLGDHTRLRQVMLNLISNAIKFTPAGLVAIELEMSDEKALVKVSDTGIGIPADEQAKLFREFYQSEHTIRSGYGGLGLGLAISRQLIESHGGIMGVRSPGDLGGGTTFFFSLPVLPATEVPPDPELHLNSGLGSIALVAKQAEWSNRLVAQLRDQGFRVSWLQADNTTDWLTPLLAAPPAAMVMDQEAAANYSWELLERLKHQPPAHIFPVLVYTLDAEHDRGTWLELNYLQKPLAAEQLQEQLARLGDLAIPRLVLVVDDNPGVLELHCRLVEQAGCRAVAARHGREALEILARTQPDLILLDLMMPEMDGFAVLEVLRANDQLRDIPVIVLTARVLDETDFERLNRGVTAVLSKGVFSSQELLERIQAVLARHQAAGGATSRLVRQAMAYMHTHYSEPLTRDQIANQVDISPDHLTACFRQEMGVPPMAYLNRYRIRQACDLLKYSDLKITQIALAVGDWSSANFTRAFKREMGISPRAYRQRNRRGEPLQ